MLQQRFAALTTAHLADACIRAQVPVRCASALLRAVVPGSRLAGRVCPARHAGSVDAFLEAFEMAAPGDVLVVDNGGRLDEACVGDLVALEAHAAGMEGMVIWGLHRDTADIRAIGLPVFSLGAIPTGPLRLDARPSSFTSLGYSNYQTRGALRKMLEKRVSDRISPGGCRYLSLTLNSF